MILNQKTNLCPIAVLEISSEISGAVARQSDELGRYDAMAQIETEVQLKARANPIALLLKKSAGLDTDWSSSVSVGVSTAETTPEAGSRVPQERRIAAEAMFKLLAENCLKCPLRSVCPSREAIGRDARRIADTSQQI